ncbi:CRISPR-associated ring nuclease [Thermococcus waiotapuensis]|uniref:CRISPR-associated ring nuclease n=1 Tax=Thermococcus waiotapuensis TaxID=90909 RepID=A0AAE4NWE7_9EURY|nr:CRISPR-associated ring nuclease [Thermococcus waiotapuensis]MDV3103756.1 CRISPR-associated ring nuclease [Thermococcus waiotapuensis]
MRAYVTTVGTSPEAVFNPLWYLMELRDWVPDEVHLLWNEKVKEQLKKTERLLEKLGKAYGVEIKVIADEEKLFTEEDPVEFRDKVLSTIKSLKSLGYEVVVDITPGRKFMSALLLGAALAGGADEVTYLHLEDWTRYIGKLLFEVPMVKQRLFFTEELTGKKGTASFGGRKKGSPEKLPVRREHLMALLDSLYLDGETSLTVKTRAAPSMADQTESPDSGRNEVILGTVRLDKEALYRVPALVNLNDELHGDFGVFRQALIAGGIVPFENWGGLVSFIKTLKADGRPVYIGFDTNALMQRAFSRVLAEEGLKERGNLIVDFVYSDEVAFEVGQIANHKLPYAQELGEFSNQPTPRARLAELAKVELEGMRKLGAERAGSRETFHGDTKIALDYKAFAEEKKANVVVLTADDRAYSQMDAMKGSGLVPFKLEARVEPGKAYPGSWEALRDTLYTLTVVLGEVWLGRYRLTGVWKGKGSSDWIRELVYLSGFEYGRVLKVLE